MESLANEGIVLLIEDEKGIRSFVRAFLGAQGLKLIEAETGHAGLAQAASHRPSVVLLDLGLPDMDGVEVIERLREWSGVPIIVLSARDAEQDKVKALDAGADDYLTKPFGVEELAARIRAALRRAVKAADEPEGQIIEAKGLRLDLANHLVTRDGQDVHLTPIEFKLLAFLARNAGKVLTHQQILRAVWGKTSSDFAHYPRIIVHQLRQKIEPDPSRPSMLRTETGVGYRFIPNREAG